MIWYVFVIEAIIFGYFLPVQRSQERKLFGRDLVSLLD